MINSLRNLYKKNGFVFRETINIYGFRDDSCQEDDVWNDYIGVCFPGENKIFIFSATTDPGVYFTKNPYEGTGGAMHLCLGQYTETYQVGNHMGKKALCQWNKPVRIWRDADKDFKFSEGDIVDNNSWNGTNIHYPGKDAEFKIKYSSAGCQVIKPDSEDYYKQWEYFFKLVTDAMSNYGIKFVDYTLFDMKDIPGAIKNNIGSILDLG